MTAEIAILNKTAVALAADSKVTLSTEGKQKTYDTVDKLFSISKIEPVGAMIYGNAEFMGFPWETIVKEYRRQNPRKCFDTLFEWADDVQAFLLSFFPFSEGDEHRAALGVAAAWVQHVVNVSLPHASSRDNFRELLLEETEQLIDSWGQATDFLSEPEWIALQPQISNGIQQITTQGVFGDDAELQARLSQLCEHAIRKLVPSPATSGLVLAGFGDKELLPSLNSFEIDGILMKRLKAVETTRFDTTRRSRGIILPFAQTDMVYRFMEGIDPDYASQIRESIGDLLFRNALETASALGQTEEQVAAMTPAFKAATKAALQAFWRANERLRRERFASPIIDMAMSLPKDELANLAESLVSLTSLQRRVSREIETVGGPIDVAVISKGDGFVWIKRKHYFDAGRNLRFVNGYFAEFAATASGGTTDDDNTGA